MWTQNKNIKKGTVIILILCIVFVLAAVLFLAEKKKEENALSEKLQAAAEADTSTDAAGTVTYNGKEYMLNPNLKNYLFIGVDKRDAMVDETVAPKDAGQADCLILLSLDSETKEGKILQINRNAMTELDVYSASGEVFITIEGQVCLQYAYCIGGKRSCFAQRKTVSEMLFETPIDGYLCMSINGIGEINDALGGVDVVMKKDYTSLDPSFMKGETVHLSGDKAYKFVHYRDTDRFNSVQDRMERQMAYVSALIKGQGNQSNESLYNLLSSFYDTYILTDMTAEELNDLTSYTWRTDDIQYLPGEMIMGEKYEEFNIDNEKLQDLILNLFYVEND